MFGRSKIRTRVVVLPLIPGAVLGAIVGFDLHRSPATITAAALAIALGVGFAMLVATSITRPLRDLATIALDLHDIRAVDGSASPRDDMLPPRPVRVAAELSDLAIAISDGRRHAVEFVAEQRMARRSVTDLVANVALRNERLLGAALDAMGEVSRRDHEPATAAAIARIHRIVARVDRSTASSLVLIGEGGRVATVASSITDVVWAAALAIESSDRVDAMALPEATIHADAVADVGHLIAELLDNAVQASSAPGRVSLIGEPTADGCYELTIVDSGSGLSEQELATANRRVRRLESLHRVPTRNVGLDVVGRLARRHGIQARLGESAEGGVVVRVLLPAALLVVPAAGANRYTIPDLTRTATDPQVAAPTTPASTNPAPTTPAPAVIGEPTPLTASSTPHVDLPVASTINEGVRGDEPEVAEPHPVEPPVFVADSASTANATDIDLRTPTTPPLVSVAARMNDADASQARANDTDPVPTLPALKPWSVEIAGDPRDARGFAPRSTSTSSGLRDRRSSVRLGAADEFLPKRDQRKWAAAIARARS